jgi:hypothetical protein
MTDTTNPKSMTIAGWVLSGLFGLFIAGASVVPKFFMPEIANATMDELGWPGGYVTMIGAMELGFLILYLIPRTSLLGAVLFTGLLGVVWRRRCGPRRPSSATSCSACIWAPSCGAACGSGARGCGLCFRYAASRPVRTGRAGYASPLVWPLTRPISLPIIDQRSVIGGRCR